eukprot:Rmarinus@m.12172
MEDSPLPVLSQNISPQAKHYLSRAEEDELFARVILGGESISVFAEVLQHRYHTAHRWPLSTLYAAIRRVLSRGTYGTPPTVRAHCSRYESGIYSFICSLHESDPEKKVTDIQSSINDQFGVTPSESWIYLAKKHVNLTYKHLHPRPQAWCGNTTLEKRKLYAEWFIDKVLWGDRTDDLIYFDETTFGRQTYPRFGWAPKGVAPTSVKPQNPPSVSVIGFCTKRIMLDYFTKFTRREGGTKQRDILNAVRCIIKLMRDNRRYDTQEFQYSQRSLLFIFDNASVHGSALKEEIKRHDRCDYRNLPPYSPFLMPLENLFHQWKQSTDFRRVTGDSSALLQIRKGFDNITSESVRHCFDHMLSYLERCLQKEDISC